MTFDGAFTDGWVRRFADSVVLVEPELTALDQRAGDGDFGINLRTGITIALAELDRDRSSKPPDLAAPEACTAPAGAGPHSGRPGASPTAAHAPLAVLATAFLDEVGGTSGPLLGLLFQEMAEAVRADAPRLTTRALAAGTRAGLAAIRRVGEASPGDKTLVDALHPAALALGRRGASAPPDRALAEAAAAAWEGVRSTAALSARRGRASYLGARARGVPDPGAVGIALLFSSAHRTVTALDPFLAVTAAPAPASARVTRHAPVRRTAAAPGGDAVSGTPDTPDEQGRPVRA